MFSAALDCNRSSFVFRYEDRSGAVAVKRICKAPCDDTSRVFAELRVWDGHKDVLQACDKIVQRRGDFFGVPNTLVFDDDGGQSLERCCRCTLDARRSLFCAVRRDVEKAFDALHKVREGLGVGWRGGRLNVRATALLRARAHSLNWRLLICIRATS